MLLIHKLLFSGLIGGSFMALSHRERVIRALSHQEPDRVPFDLGGTVNSSIHIEEYQKLKAHFGIEAEDTIVHKMMQTALVHEPVLEALDIDFRPVLPGPPDGVADIPVGEDGYQDEWGVVRRKPPGTLYYDLVKSPLAGAITCLLYTSPSPRDATLSRMPSSA